MAGVNAATGQALSPAALAAGVAIATVTPSTGLATGERARTLAELKADSINFFDFLNVSEVADVHSRNSSTDYKVQLDAAITKARAQRKPLYIPSSVVPTSGSHYLAKGTVSDYQAFVLIGDGALGTAGTGSSLSTGHTCIMALQKERPVLAIETARGVHVQGIAIGVHSSMGAPSYTGEPVDTQATYIASGARTDRYSPFCGIAVDPTVGVQPTGGGYAAGAVSAPLTYQGRTGGLGGSAHITLRDVSFTDFPVGLMHQPDGTTLQGDTLMIDACRFKFCDIAIAIGNTQSRGVLVVAPEFSACRTAVDGVTYSAQTGCPPMLVGGQYIGCFRLFRFDNQYGHLNIVGLYAETFKTLGSFGKGASNTKFPLSLTGCEFKPGTTGWAMPPWFLESYSPCEAKSTSFRYFVGGNPDVVNFVGDQPMLIEGGTFAGLNTGYRPKIGINADLGKTKVTLARCSTVETTTMDLDDNPARLFTLPTRINATQRTRHVEDHNGRYVYQPGNPNTYVNDTASGLSIDGTTGVLTFTPGDATLYVQGDILYWLMLALDTTLTHKVPAFKVASASGAATVTASPLFDKSYYDTVAHNGNTISIAVEEWAPGTLLVGDLAASTTVSNVSPTTIIKNGDWLARNSSNLPANCRVVSGAGTATLTLNKAASTSKTTCPLYFGRLVPTDIIAGQKTYGAGAVGAGLTVQTSVTATGTVLGDFTDASFAAALPTGMVMKSEAAANSVIVSFTNTTAGSLTPVGEIYVTSKHRPI